MDSGVFCVYDGIMTDHSKDVTDTLWGLAGTAIGVVISLAIWWVIIIAAVFAVGLLLQHLIALAFVLVILGLVALVALR